MNSLLRHNEDAGINKINKIAAASAGLSIPAPKSQDYDWVLISGFIVILT